MALVSKIAQRVSTSLLLLVLHLVLTPAALGQQSFLTTDQAFQLRATRTAPEEIRLEWSIREGYYLYRDKIVAADADRRALPVTTVPGVIKDDPNFGTTEIYWRRAEGTLAGDKIRAEPGRSITVTYQGCQDGGICYMPVTKRLDLSSLAIQDTDLTPPELQQDLANEWQPASGDDAKDPPITLADDATGGLVASLLSSGGVLLLLASFLLFGIGLAFTPCVLPMYPILAGVLTGSGQALSPRRGFFLSSVYVVAMASAFGLLGIAAAWSGYNLQVLLQSPTAILIVSAVFVALALSMFGLYELRLPSRWVNAVAGSRANGTANVRSAAVLGVTSALVVGPCVTAPLAGALLYIGQTGDVTLGAASLFALGIGKGIPLVAFGTFGAKALPKTGAWMTSVKQAFGLVFLATAAWLISRIIPDNYGLALWALLLIGVSVYLGAFDTLTRDAPGRTRAAKAAGLAAALYGVLLAVGAASGAGDPFRPLGHLAQRVAPSAEPTTFARVVDTEQLNRRMAQADGRPTLVYFTADWCVSCAIIERTVLPDATVRQRLAGFNLIKADVTDNRPEQQQMMQTLRVVGPPTMIFVDAAGREVSGSRLVGEVTAQNLLASTDRVTSK